MILLRSAGQRRRKLGVLVLGIAPAQQRLRLLTFIGDLQVVEPQSFELELDRPVAHDGREQVTINVGAGNGTSRHSRGQTVADRTGGAYNPPRQDLVLPV